jgi:uncharacterized protein YbjT (DUF2867 family)
MQRLPCRLESSFVEEYIFAWGADLAPSPTHAQTCSRVGLLIKLAPDMSDTDEPKAALLAGASGLVGGYLLDALLEAGDFNRVYAITRRPLTREHPRLANRTVQFDKLGAQLTGLSCHTAFCCLGTTIRAAGSQEAFRHVDFDYVLAFAHVAKSAQVQRFVVVSAAGADPHSANFYMRTKGETEQALALLGFAGLDIVQPGVLLGWRREMRPLDVVILLMPLVNPLLLGSRAMYRGVPARAVAHAMLGAARTSRRGVSRYTYAGMLALAKKGGLRPTL